MSSCWRPVHRHASHGRVRFGRWGCSSATAPTPGAPFDAPRRHAEGIPYVFVNEIGKAVADSLHQAGLPVILAAYVIRYGLRIAQGAATVTIVTTSGIVAPPVAKLGYSLAQHAPLVVASAGSIIASHVNDGGLWIVSRYFGPAVGETLRGRGAFGVARSSLLGVGLLLVLLRSGLLVLLGGCGLLLRGGLLSVLGSVGHDVHRGAVGRDLARRLRDLVAVETQREHGVRAMVHRLLREPAQRLVPGVGEQFGQTFELTARHRLEAGAHRGEHVPAADREAEDLTEHPDHLVAGQIVHCGQQDRELR
ncbi:hypothetical protein FG385_31930 [Amycolatopsis alkalitolerans]|uniref:Uncharacterized protein n=1 Tax=Amycolatopsis alkalitolerans TaxID=2547244 RepID=A0A5C4LQ35_9PSEU|nr:hypothetical protein FG385_31930 [Amycolatopsis alkalitolerans]